MRHARPGTIRVPSSVAGGPQSSQDLQRCRQRWARPPGCTPGWEVKAMGGVTDQPTAQPVQTQPRAPPVTIRSGRCSGPACARWRSLRRRGGMHNGTCGTSDVHRARLPAAPRAQRLRCAPLRPPVPAERRRRAAQIHTHTNVRCTGATPLNNAVLSVLSPARPEDDATRLGGHVPQRERRWWTVVRPV